MARSSVNRHIRCAYSLGGGGGNAAIGGAGGAVACLTVELSLALFEAPAFDAAVALAAAAGSDGGVSS
ncbi:MAG TPA: hypothetical protein VN867_10440 [Candidatus Binataceae bacterium]|nr:hypothetical protein [Candidatus Binataceae bacterium]